jgi:hypothetical protein
MTAFGGVKEEGGQVEVVVELEMLGRVRRREGYDRRKREDGRRGGVLGGGGSGGGVLALLLGDFVVKKDAVRGKGRGVGRSVPLSTSTEGLAKDEKEVASFCSKRGKEERGGKTHFSCSHG